MVLEHSFNFEKMYLWIFDFYDDFVLQFILIFARI